MRPASRQPEKLAGFAGNAAPPHQGFSDEDHLRAATRQPLHIRPRVNAAFRDEQRVLARGCVAKPHRQSFRRCHIHFERLEVAVVDADELRVHSQRAVQLCLVVHFHERGKRGNSATTREEAKCSLVAVVLF